MKTDVTQRMANMSSEQILEGIDIDMDSVETSKERWRAAVNFDADLDRWPLIISFPFAKQDATESYPPVKDLGDPDKVLWNSMNGILHRWLLDDDSMPFVTLRSMGICATLPRMFGAELYPEKDAEPQVVPFIEDMNDLSTLAYTETRLANCTPVREVMETIRYIQPRIKGKGFISSTVHGGSPFSIASMMRDARLYEDVYTRPERVYELCSRN